MGRGKRGHAEKQTGSVTTSGARFERYVSLRYRGGVFPRRRRDESNRVESAGGAVRRGGGVYPRSGQVRVSATAAGNRDRAACPHGEGARRAAPIAPDAGWH